jgi:hypothetical protein
MRGRPATALWHAETDVDAKMFWHNGGNVGFRSLYVGDPVSGNVGDRCFFGLSRNPRSALAS